MNAEIHCPRRLLCLAGMLCVRLFSEKKNRRSRTERDFQTFCFLLCPSVADLLFIKYYANIYSTIHKHTAIFRPGRFGFPIQLFIMSLFSVFFMSFPNVYMMFCNHNSPEQQKSISSALCV